MRRNCAFTYIYIAAGMKLGIIARRLPSVCLCLFSRHAYSRFALDSAACIYTAGLLCTGIISSLSAFNSSELTFQPPLEEAAAAQWPVVGDL